METKICSKCKRELTVDNFYKGNGKDGLSYRCKTCVCEHSSAWYVANAARQKANRKVQYGTGAEKVKATAKAWRETNPDRMRADRKVWYEANTEKVKATRKAWREANHEKTRQYTQHRRARKLELPCTLTLLQWEQIKKDFNHVCCYCGEEKLLHQEHFLALSNGGEYSHNNIIPVCQSCNSTKHDRDFFDWYPGFKHYSKQREMKILNYLGYKNGIQQLSIL